MMTGLTIREVRGLPDYQTLVPLIAAEWPAEFGEATDAEMVAAMRESHKDRTDTVKLLIDGGQVAGFYRYSLWPRDEASPRKAHLMDIAVLPECRRAGLGTAMVRDLVEDCTRRGLASVLSRTFRSNEASIRLHRRMGFEIAFETADSIVWNLCLSDRVDAE